MSLNLTISASDHSKTLVKEDLKKHFGQKLMTAPAFFDFKPVQTNVLSELTLPLTAR